MSCHVFHMTVYGSGVAADYSVSVVAAVVAIGVSGVCVGVVGVESSPLGPVPSSFPSSVLVVGGCSVDCSDKVASTCWSKVAEAVTVVSVAVVSAVGLMVVSVVVSSVPGACVVPPGLAKSVTSL